ncbi:MAG: ABC transporter ATP-binding protein [Thermodesulfobacteriota bacterium]
MNIKKNLIKIENLKKYFPVKKGFFSKTRDYVKAVDDITLDIEATKTLGLVGESGSGKTTLGKTLIRLLNPSEGRIVFDNIDITHLSSRDLRPIRRDMQIIFQNPYGSLNPRMNVESIISEGIAVHNTVSKNERKDYVLKLLNEVGLNKDVIGRYPHEFSGGQRQRIAIARAIALKPKFIVCDEPVSALDVSVQAQIINLLQQLQETYGLTYLFIAHDLRAVKHISDKVAVMYLGKVVEIANSEEIYLNPLHPYTKILISAIPDINKKKIDLVENNFNSLEIPSPINVPSGCSFHPRCPIATEICRQVVPMMEEKTEEHKAACHNV